MPRAICCQGPAGSTCRKTLEEEHRHIAGIERPDLVVLETDGAGHEHGAEAGQIRDFFAGDQRDHAAAEVGVDWNSTGDRLQ